MEAKYCSSLTLSWTNIMVSTFLLQMIFVLIVTSASLYLKFWRSLLVKVLKENNDTRVKLPLEN